MPHEGGRRISRVFSTNVSAGGSGSLTHDVGQPATVEQLTVRFYPGPRLDLELRPFVEREDGRREDLLQVEGRSGDEIVGDDDKFEYFLVEPVEKDDTIGVEYTNNDGSNAYDFWVMMELDRAGGVERAAGLLERVVGGVV